MVREIFLKNKEEQEQKKVHKAKKKEMALYKKAEEAHKLKERMAEVQPVWTKYFEMAAGENDASGGGNARLEPIIENNEENIEISAC